MSRRPSLARSIPFWGLLVASAASAAAGALMLVDKLGVMTSTLTDGTATGVEVYVGQSVAVVGAILLGAGVVGILLALTVASLSTLRPHAPVEVLEPVAADEEIDEIVPADHGYQRGLGYTEAVETVPAEPVAEDLTASR